MDMKVCGKCKILKEDSEFCLKNKNTGLLSWNCKSCHNEYRNKHYQLNKKKYVNNVSNRKKLLQRKLLELLSTKKCKDCGNSDSRVLEFDHVREKKFMDISVMVMNGYRWENILREIEKCDVRCANCHRIVTIERSRNYRKHI